MRLAAVGTLVPGVGLLASGRRRLGLTVLGLVVTGLVALILALSQASMSGLIESAFDRTQLAIIGGGLTIIAIGWLVVALVSHYSLEPRGLPPAKRLLGSLLVIVTASIVISPLAVGAKYAWTHRDLLGGISQESALGPDLAPGNPWKDKPRVNVLLLGSDAGANRTGTRPDTLILASIDTRTGDTVMFSLPRNLERVPFPPGTELNEVFPDGFTNGVPENLDFMLNSVYENAPDFVSASAFQGSDDPGADATKLAVSAALGLDVDYHVTVNLAGFEQVVDAIGGVTLDVDYPVPMGTFVSRATGVCEWTSTPDRWIMPGKNVHLEGARALWFARARCTPYDARFPDQSGGNSVVNSDYNRMERQRCVLGAVAGEINPVSMLPRFQSLARVAKGNVTTDIPTDMFPAFAELGLKVKDGKIASLPFTDDVVHDRRYPDYNRIHRLVAEALDPSSRATAAITPPSPTTATSSDGGTEAGSETTAPKPSEPHNVADVC